MQQDLESSLEVQAPLEQAGRCLDIWLKEEKRSLPPRSRHRAAALMARYFLHEGNVPDQLMLSFLRHYSGWREIDMDDPASVRLEIKAILDQSVPLPQPVLPRALTAFGVGIILTTVSFMMWDIAHLKITQRQQENLKAMVAEIAATQKGLTHASIWAKVKDNLGVKRYQDIAWWDYAEASQQLERMKSAAGAGM